METSDNGVSGTKEGDLCGVGSSTSRTRMVGSGRVRGFLGRDGSGVFWFSSSSSERIIGFHIQHQREKESLLLVWLVSSNKRGIQENSFDIVILLFSDFIFTGYFFFSLLCTYY